MRVELHLAVDWGASIPERRRAPCRRASREYLRGWRDVDPAAVDVSVDEIGPAAVTRIAGLTGATLPTAPTVCHECVWWQSRDGRTRRQAEVDPRDRGGVGRVGDGLLRRRRARCSGRCSTGRRDLFPRAAELPAGPPSDDAVLVTCAYLTDPSKPWVMQSLFLTAIGEARDKGARALEAFAYRYSEGESTFERFHVHKTIFPRDFLADFGFQTCARRAASSSCASSSAACSPSSRARARRSCASCATRSCPRCASA